MTIFALTISADMVKLVDMPDLGSGAARRVGSSPIIRTKASHLEELFFWNKLSFQINILYYLHKPFSFKFTFQ